MTFGDSRAEYYLHRVSELRALAKQARDSQIKAALEMIAREYDMLAASVESGLS